MHTGKWWPLGLPCKATQIIITPSPLLVGPQQLVTEAWSMLSYLRGLGKGAEGLTPEAGRGGLKNPDA